ncbi:MAG: WbqC family protein [bacterium]|nr:WbqC family protein [bacterium]
MEQAILLTTAYLPSIAWFQQAVLAEPMYLETQENYLKQSYRNRCKILTANGVLDLIVPVVHADKKQLITQIAIQDTAHWRKQHWQAICSAYGKSAFFLYYRDPIEQLYFGSNQTHLFDFNLAFIKLIAKFLKLNLSPIFTQNYEKQTGEKLDLRTAFHAKGGPNADELLFEKKYFQVFAEKFEFVPNLSILDLLFNVGPLSKDFLVKL